MPNRPPAFQFYPKDFISDLNVEAMTLEETGAYIRLLCLCWIEDGIPIEAIERIIQRWFNQTSTKRQPSVNVWSKIKHCFYEKDGKLRNRRLDFERKKQISWSEKSSLGGLKSSINKQLRKGGSTKRQPSVNQSQASSLHLQSSSSDEDSRESYIKSKNFGHLFEDFWKKYPPERRNKKSWCQMKFSVLCKQDKYNRFIKVTLGYFDFLKAQRLKTGFNQMPMYSSTWLNNWEGDAEKYENFEYKPRL